MALVLSVFFSRLVHWYFRPDSYSGFWQALTDFTSGGFALLGAFLGCGLTVLLLWLLRLEEEPGEMLDAMSLGGFPAFSAPPTGDSWWASRACPLPFL